MAASDTQACSRGEGGSSDTQPWGIMVRVMARVGVKVRVRVMLSDRVRVRVRAGVKVRASASGPVTVMVEPAARSTLHVNTMVRVFAT